MQPLLVMLVPIVLLPSVLAEPYVHATLAPESKDLSLSLNDDVELSYVWVMRLENTTCSEGTEFGLDFVVSEVQPSQALGWVGMSFNPSGTIVTFAQGSDSKSGNANLEVSVAEDAPEDGEATIRLDPDLNLQNAGNCSPHPTALTRGASLVIHVTGADETSVGDGNGPGEPRRTPAPHALLTLLAAVVLLRVMDGMHRNRPPRRL